MPHIHTNPGEHDHTASAIIVRTDQQEPRVLLHLHKKLGLLLQPGGHIELNETPWQAVLREIHEETGYESSQLKLLQPQLRLNKLKDSDVHPQPVVHSTHKYDAKGEHKHIDIAYGFVTQSDPIKMPSDGESTDLRWFSANELKLLGPDEIHESTRQICEFVLEDILAKWEIIDLPVPNLV